MGQERLAMFPMLVCPKPRVWAATILSVILTMANSGATDTRELTPSRGSWQAGLPLAVEVIGGHATFDIPSPDPSSRTLVIVSSLARSGGPFPIRMLVRPVDKMKPITLAVPTRVRSAALGLPAITRVPEPTSGLPPYQRTFHLLAGGGNVTVASNYLAVEGRLMAVGRRIQVYVDSKDLGAVSSSTLRDLVETFDGRIYPEVAGRFGPAVDVDGDGRFTVLFSSWLNRLAGGKASVDGFVRGADLDRGLGGPFGNRCDMMYLNTSMAAGAHLRSIVAHEYTHAVTFSRKALAGGRVGPEEEGWLDEGIAHLVEDALDFSKSNIDYRVSAFLSRPERYRLVVDDYYAADLFRSHGNRGATYLFLRWCVDRYGPGLLDALVRSELRGMANLEAATGSDFADLFRRWTVALYSSGIDPSREGEDAYRSIDPRGEFEDWILAGPRVATIVPGESGDSWLAEATTAHYVLLEGSSRGAMTVEVVGPPEAGLQVTTMSLPEGSGRPELKVKALSSEDGTVQVRAEVVERDGQPVRLGALTWEALVPAQDSRSRNLSRGGLDMLGIASKFGTSALPPGGALNSRLIALPEFREEDGPLVFKAVGTDARGRRVAAWTEVELPSKARSIARETITTPENPGRR